MCAILVCMRLFNSPQPLCLGAIQETPSNPFPDNVVIPTRIELDPEGEIVDIYTRKDRDFTAEQLALLRSFSSRMRQDMIENHDLDPDANSVHLPRVRTGASNFRPFTHYDNISLSDTLFDQVANWGRNGFYAFTTGRPAVEWFPGSFEMPEWLRGPLLPVLSIPILELQTRGLQPQPLVPDMMYQFGLSTVHTAPEGAKTLGGLFIGGYGREKQ